MAHTFTAISENTLIAVRLLSLTIISELILKRYNYDNFDLCNLELPPENTQREYILKLSSYILYINSLQFYYIFNTARIDSMKAKYSVLKILITHVK